MKYEVDTKTTIFFGGAILTLFGIIAYHRLSLWRTYHYKFVEAHNKFHDSFTYTIQQLENRNTTLNVLILNDFPKHDIAMKDFIHYLRGLRKCRFLTKWQKYEEKYSQVKELGKFGPVIAIAPSIEDSRINSPQDIEKWENQRRKELLKIIDDLITISKRNTWF